jgi:hypothetical protein
MRDAERFMEDTGRSGGDSGRFVRQADNENIQRELRISREDTGRFRIGNAEKFTNDIGKSAGNTG